jgi:galactokinase
MSTEDFVQTIQLEDKLGTRISRVHYQAIKDFMLSLLEDGAPISINALITITHNHFEATFKEQTGWYVYNVKLDLEARGLIHHENRNKKLKQSMISKASTVRSGQDNANSKQPSTERQRTEIYQSVLNKFQELFHKRPLMVHAPGRINLIGEHTDYNNGYVMPAAIDKGVLFAIAASSTDTIIYSIKYKQFLSVDLNNIQPSKSADWHNYLLGVLFSLQEKGHSIKPFVCVFEGDLPAGAGLSSSAAMECGFVMALNKLFHFVLSKEEMIHIAQWSEHHFVGVKCGIMDQFASMLGKEDHVIHLDCKTLEYKYYPLALGEYCLLLCDTNVKHSLASSEYNTRRAECESGVQIIKSDYPEINSLRDVDHEMLKTCMSKMTGDVFDRCRYIVQENERVLAACEALEKGDMTVLGEKMYETHEGLSSLYKVSCPELDYLVDLTKPFAGILGSRMMGGGFGGCTINIIESTFVGTFISHAKFAYKEKFQRELSYYVVKTGNGASVIEHPLT